MKYFTADIWAGWQGDAVTFDLAQKKWLKNLAHYKINVRRLAPRLGQRQGRFFLNHSLHDGRLLLFAVSDWPGPILGKKHVPPETSVEMTVLSWGRQAVIYRLFYTQVIDISVRTKNNLFPLANSRFGDWGYDELLPDKRGFFRHNILFQTGTELSVAFQKFRFETESVTPGRLKRYARPTPYRK